MNFIEYHILCAGEYASIVSIVNKGFEGPPNNATIMIRRVVVLSQNKDFVNNISSIF